MSAFGEIVDKLIAQLVLELPGLIERHDGDVVAALDAFNTAFAAARKGSIVDRDSEIAAGRAQVDATLAAREKAGL